MPRPLKKYLVKALLGLLIAAKAMGKLLLNLLALLVLPFILIWRFGLRRVIFLLYALMLKAKVATGTLVAPMRKTIMALLGHRYVVHGTVILLVVFVCSKSIYARDLDVGQDSTKALIYGMLQIPEEEADFDVDSSDLAELGYLDASASGTVPFDQVFTYDRSGVLTPVIIPGENIERVVISKPEKYVVRQGDTISAIAQKYGVSINTLLWANSMTARSLLRVGQELTVLPVTGVLHKVKKGETLSAIAKKYGTDVDKILTSNRVAKETEIQIGEELIIPDGRPPAAPVPAYVAPRAVASRNVFAPPADAPPGVSAAVGQMVWPTDSRRINQYYKWNHPGLDINGRKENAIYASDDGIIAKAGWNSGGYGNMILIDHGNGIVTRYGHASVMYVKAGDQVTKGQTIAMVGSTGRSTGPHLHYEVYQNGRRRNPLEFFK